MKVGFRLAKHGRKKFIEYNCITDLFCRNIDNNGDESINSLL
jgi:hypothetical protein